MRLTRVHVDGPLSVGARISVGGTAANHILRVLRLRASDALIVFDGLGGEYAANIVEARKDTVLVDVRDYSDIDRESTLPLTLAQGVSRGERMDWVIQKATELGVTRIIPILTERSVVKLDAAQAEKKHQHWRGIAIAACEQSGRNRVPQLDLPVKLHDFLAQTPREGARVLLSPTGTLRLTDLPSPQAGLIVLIGPEGGLSDVEQESALRVGFNPIRLGPRILRTETAAIAALTIMQQEFGDL